MIVWTILVSLLGCAEEEAKETTESDDAVEQQAEDVLPQETARKILHEVFTGSTCGPCLGAEEVLFGVLADDEERYTHISYQVGSDPYVSQEAVDRRMYYIPGESTYSIPYIYVDGIHGFHPVEVNDDEGYLQDDFERFAGALSTVQLAVTHEVQEQTVSVAVTILPLQDNPSENLKLQVAIIEKKTEQNVGSNGQTEFHHVMKKMVPDSSGTSLMPFVRGEQLELDVSYTFVGEYDEDTSISNMINHTEAHTVEEFSDLAVVVFIQDDVTQEVHQSAWSE